MRHRPAASSPALAASAVTMVAALLIALLLLPATSAQAATPAMDGAWQHTIALRADGTVWAWGANDHGQLGSGTDAGRIVPAQVRDSSALGRLSDIESIAAANNFSLALAADGSVWAWGDNSYGQLGDGTTTDRFLPVRVKNGSGAGMLGAIAAISAGSEHSLALADDGTVWAWGHNDRYQLGDRTNTDKLLPVQVMSDHDADPSAAPVPLSGITAISAGRFHSLALVADDGTIRAWGDNNFGQLGYRVGVDWGLPRQVVASVDGPALSRITAISAGEYHSLALDEDGMVWAWGSNEFGQLGDGTTTTVPRLLPAQVTWDDDDDPSTAPVPLSHITAISAGDTHSLALADDGTVWAWGNNKDGQLGDATTTDRLFPVKVKGLFGIIEELDGIQAIACGSDYSLALDGDGMLWTWGSNTAQRLGQGDWTLTSSAFPVWVKSPDNVSNLDMSLRIVPRRSTGAKPHTVAFQAYHYPASDLLWAFGDGSTSTDSSPTHTYTETGTYPVTLTVTISGSEQTTMATVVVQDEPSSGGSSGGCALAPGASLGLEWLLLAGLAVLTRARWRRP